DSDTGFWIYVSQPGYYGFRTTLNQGILEAAIEWMTENTAGQKFLINSSDPASIKAYATADVIRTRPYLESATPEGEGVDPANNIVDIVIVNSDTVLIPGSIALSYDGAVVSPTITPNSPGPGKTRVSFNLGTLVRNTTHTLQISFQDSGESTIVKNWSFSV